VGFFTGVQRPAVLPQGLHVEPESAATDSSSSKNAWFRRANALRFSAGTDGADVFTKRKSAKSKAKVRLR
jgi:hypothetical protein